MNFKYSASFSSIVRPLVSAEKDKYLAMASLIDVGNFIPDIDTEINVDLLPVAFNACVVNRVNKNGDVIDASTAVEIYKSFANKPINIEHNRQNVVGVILTAGFSEFGTDLPLTEEQVKDSKKPFNITLGGVVWKVVSPALAETIENSNDPTGDEYQAISASWELGFSDYHLIISSTEDKNIENSLLIDDREMVDDLKANLRAEGGSGKIDGGGFVYRKVVGQVVPLGIGLTANPAADVKGVSIIKPEMKIQVDSSEKNSLSGYDDVNSNIIIEKISAPMKINKIEDITSELLKTVEASAIADFIQEQLKSASEHFVAEKTEKESAIEEAGKKFDVLSAEYNAVKAELENITKSLRELEAAKAAHESEEKFNQRMALFDSEFELDSEDREVIASDIKDLNEEAFSAYHGKMSKIMKSKKKSAKKTEEKTEDKNLPPWLEKKEGEKDAKASADLVENIVEKAIENGKEEKTTVPVSMAAAEPSLFEKYKKAFSLENFEIRN